MVDQLHSDIRIFTYNYILHMYVHENREKFLK